jgi:uncharacterized protein (TIGR00730 family)
MVMDQQPLAYLSREFVESEDGRPVRLLAEYLEPLRRFRDEQIQDTVVFFGSARVTSRERADRALSALLRDQAHRPDDDVVAAARRAVDWSRYYEDARTLARELTTWTHTLDTPHHRFVVCSGGGPGIMEAANRGASEAGGKTIGLNISLPYEQGANAYVSRNLHFEFHYFFMRKFWFAYLAKALVVFPGGFGTMDEMFEILTLAQTEKLSKKIEVLLYSRDYWERVLHFEPLVDAGAISAGDLSLFKFVDSPQQAFDCLKTHLLDCCLESPHDQEARTPGLAKTRT